MNEYANSWQKDFYHYQILINVITAMAEPPNQSNKVNRTFQDATFIHTRLNSGDGTISFSINTLVILALI